MTHNVKIARLPRPLREELNRRLARNEDGAILIDSLNAAPEVKAFLARDFAGEPITQQNLHEWRDTGFVEWQSRQHLFAEAAELTDANGEWDALAANDFTERLAAVLVVRYADALAGWNGGDDEAFRLKLRDLRHFNQDLAVLRRYNQTAARLKMQQLAFHQKAKQRTEAMASPREHSEVSTPAPDERVAQPRLEAAAAQPADSAASTTSSPSASSMPSAPLMPVAVSPTQAAARTVADVTVAAVVRDTGTPVLNMDLARCCPTEARPVMLQPGFIPVPDRGSVEGDAGKSLSFGPATLTAGMIRANLAVQFADSLRNALTVIQEKSVHAFDVDDRRAVQSAYAGSVATLNRLGKETDFLRTELPGFAGVDRVSAAVEVLQREYPPLKTNLFQGCWDAVAVGIQQLRASV
jgi:hypothetical protein